MERDRLCRVVPYAAARSINPAAAEYQFSLVELLHFAEHSRKILNEDNNRLQHTLYVVTADGKVSDSEFIELLEACRDLYKPMSKIASGIKELPLDNELLKKLEISSTNELFEEFRFADPDRDNLQSWLNNYGGWLMLILDSLARVRNAVLEQLLVLEEQIKTAFLENGTVSVPAHTTKLVEQYETMIPGEEPQFRSKLTFWDKFQAGIGLFPTAAKFTAGGAIILLAMFVGSTSLISRMHIHNGFEMPVEVTVNGESHIVDAFGEQVIEFSGDADISSRFVNGEKIEAFTGEAENEVGDYVYNIAYGSYLMHSKIYYSSFPMAPEQTPLGAIRWTETDADYIFEESPEYLNVSGKMATKTVISALDAWEPVNYPVMEGQEENVKRMIRNHLQWDSPEGIHAGGWLSMASTIPEARELLHFRLNKFQDDVAAWRILMDLSSGDEKNGLRNTFEEKYRKTGKSEYLYLSLRILEDGPEQDSAFVEAHKKYPNDPWLAQAYGYLRASDDKWDEALRAYRRAEELSKPVGKMIGEMLFRIERRQGVNFNSLVLGRFESNPRIDYAYNLEHGNPNYVDRNSDIFFYYLNSGDLVSARGVLERTGRENRPFYLWYYAASVGAEEEYVREALASDLNTTVHGGNVASMVGLMARKNQLTEQTLERFGAFYSLDKTDLEIFGNFVTAVSSNKLSEADRILSSVDHFLIRAVYKEVGCVILGEEAPETWVFDVHKLLFADERPWVGAAALE